MARQDDRIIRRGGTARGGGDAETEDGAAASGAIGQMGSNCCNQGISIHRMEIALSHAIMGADFIVGMD
jgi:hypothetical protein